MRPYDVVVVGGRPAGASTAFLLARGGLRVALVDRSAYGSDTLSTHALMRAGVLQLARWGLLDEVIASGAPAVRRTLFRYGDDETIRVTIKPRAGVEALFAPRRYILDRILVDAAARAGVDVWHRTRMTRPITGRGGRVGGIEAKTPDGRIMSIPAAMTVGADGMRSTLAAHVNAPVTKSGSATGSVLYRYMHDLPAEGYEWVYGRGSGAGLIPTHDGLTCMFVSTTRAQMRRLRRDGTDAAIDQLLKIVSPALHARVLGSGAVEGRTHGWSGQPGFLRRPWGPGWALVGDAGYFKDPITAHGITDALRDAELLSDAIIEALAGARTESAALCQYEATRDRLSAGLFDATEAVAGYEWSDLKLRGLLRAVAAAMSDEVDHLSARPPVVDPATVTAGAR